jgi:hypothetical protein
MLKQLLPLVYHAFSHWSWCHCLCQYKYNHGSSKFRFHRYQQTNIAWKPSENYVGCQQITTCTPNSGQRRQGPANNGPRVSLTHRVGHPHATSLQAFIWPSCGLHTRNDCYGVPVAQLRRPSSRQPSPREQRPISQGRLNRDCIIFIARAGSCGWQESVKPAQCPKKHEHEGDITKSQAEWPTIVEPGNKQWGGVDCRLSLCCLHHQLATNAQPPSRPNLRVCARNIFSVKQRNKESTDIPWHNIRWNSTITYSDHTKRPRQRLILRKFSVRGHTQFCLLLSCTGHPHPGRPSSD